AHTLLGAVELMQGVQMLQQQLLLPDQAGLGRYLAMAQIVFDLAEDPGPALGSAADHDRVGSGVLQNLSGLLRGIDIPVGEQRDANGLADFGDGVIFGLAGIQLAAGATMYRKGLDTALLGYAGHPHAIAAVFVPASADLQG